MTLAELRDKADAKLATFWTALVAKEEAYFAKHGKYFQLLVTPETNVVDGVDNDFTARHPSDEVHVVDVDFNFASQVPFNIEVHEWVGREGSGFKAVAQVELPDGRKFTRSRDSDNVDSGWGEIVPPPEPVTPPAQELVLEVTPDPAPDIVPDPEGGNATTT